MRRFLAWAAGLVGGLAAYRLLARRPQPALPPPGPEPAPEVDPRAAELRARLDEKREAEPEPAPAAEETPEQRRARVHERGRAAVDEMQRSD
jgi:hypothetical protein